MKRLELSRSVRRRWPALGRGAPALFWALAACAPAAEEPLSPPYVGPTWPEPQQLEPAGAFAAAHPAAFERLSGWVTHVAGPVEQRPDIGHRGAFGCGNGWTFGLFGLADPLNTLHGLAGPTYDKRDRFFGDYSLRLAPAGGTAEHFDEEWAGRSLVAPVVLTRGRLGELQLDTIDFAPASDDPLERSCLLRVVTVSNTGAEPAAPHELQIHPARPVAVQTAPAALVELTEQRALTTAFAGGEGVIAAGRLTLPLEALEPGAETMAVLAHCSAEGAAPAAVPALAAGALIDATTAAYQAWEQELLQVELPSSMVADFIDGMKLTLKVQTSAGGASCPMSQYTRTWARDHIGPVLALLDLGAHEDVQALMDYTYGAILLGGDLANSYAADLDLTDLPAPPDWDSLPPLGDKVAAETPSYLVRIYGAYYLHTGLTERAAERFGLLRRSLLAQGFSEPGELLPFTGDETFRTAMNVAYGLPLNYPHFEKSWSANSSLLWLGAAPHFIRLAAALGHGADAAAAADRAAAVEAALEASYLLADGCLSSHQDRQSGEPWPAPFEDVALKVTWAGWLDGDDPRARELLSCHLSRLGIAPGQLVSPVHPDHAGNILLPEAKAIQTGMLPGYTLSALTAAGHPDAASAFNLLGASASTSGSFQEYMITDDLSGLTLIYDPAGALGDYTAKFRPWEGGINLSAVLQYLLGWVPRAPDSTLALRPHLPAGWPSMAFRGLRAGADRFDVQLERLAAGVAISVRSRAAADYVLTVRWDAPAGAPPPLLSAQGEQLAEAEVERRTHFGLQSVQSPDLPLGAGQTVVILAH